MSLVMPLDCPTCLAPARSITHMGMDIFICQRCHCQWDQSMRRRARNLFDPKGEQTFDINESVYFWTGDVEPDVGVIVHIDFARDGTPRYVVRKDNAMWPRRADQLRKKTSLEQRLDELKADVAQLRAEVRAS